MRILIAEVERLCELGEEVSLNAIEVHIHRLRKKI